MEFYDIDYNKKTVLWSNPKKPFLFYFNKLLNNEKNYMKWFHELTSILPFKNFKTGGGRDWTTEKSLCQWDN